MSRQGKITVKHYLNKRAQGVVNGEEHFFPVYIQIIVSGHKAQLKSKLSEGLKFYRNYTNKLLLSSSVNDLISKGYLSENLLERVENEKTFPVYSLLEDEIRILKFIIITGQPFTNKAFSLVSISDNYKIYLRDIGEVLDEAIKKVYLEELNKVFLQFTSDTQQRKIFKVVNFFIHHINWKNSFSEYYQNTYEVLPSEIKLIENYLSTELKSLIKAYMAFSSRTNYLKRFLDKQDAGMFPFINIIDWEEKGKDFIFREFQKLFGKQKASEYIKSLDIILHREIIPPVQL